MLQVSILPEDVPTIQRDRFYHPQPHIMMRMHTLALHHKGESAARIAQLLDRDPRTIRQCLKKYRDGGLKAVYEYEKHKPESELENFSELIEKELESNDPITLEDGMTIRSQSCRTATRCTASDLWGSFTQNWTEQGHTSYKPFALACGSRRHTR